MTNSRLRGRSETWRRAIRLSCGDVHLALHADTTNGDDTFTKVTADPKNGREIGENICGSQPQAHKDSFESLANAEATFWNSRSFLHQSRHVRWNAPQLLYLGNSVPELNTVAEHSGNVTVQQSRVDTNEAPRGHCHKRFLFPVSQGNGFSDVRMSRSGSKTCVGNLNH